MVIFSFHGFIQSLFTESSDICGIMLVLNNRLFLIHDQIIDEGTDAIIDQLFNLKISQTNHEIALNRLESVLKQFNDRETVERRLKYLSQFIQSNQLNQLTETHPLYNLAKQEMQEIVSKCDLFEDTKCIILDSIEFTMDLLSKGEWYEDVECIVAYLHGEINKNGHTPPFGIQFKGHYYLNQISLKNGKQIIKIINIDSIPPNHQILSVGRPFDFVVNVIINYHNFNQLNLLGLRLMDLVIGCLKRIILDSPESQDFTATIFQSLLNESLFPFEFNDKKLQQILIERTKLILSDLNILKDNHQNKNDNHYVKHVSLFSNTLSNKAYIYLITALRFHEKEICKERGNNIMLQIIKEFKKLKENTDKWEIDILNCINLWHKCWNLLMKESNENHLDVLQGKLKECLSDVMQCKDCLYSSLFCEVTTEKLISLQQNECKFCVTNIENMMNGNDMDLNCKKFICQQCRSPITVQGGLYHICQGCGSLYIHSWCLEECVTTEIYNKIDMDTIVKCPYCHNHNIRDENNKKLWVAIF